MSFFQLQVNTLSSHDVTQSRTHISPQCCYGAGSRTLCIYTRILHSHNMGLHHSAKVCEPIRRCNSDFRDVLTESDVRLPQRIAQYLQLFAHVA